MKLKLPKQIFHFSSRKNTQTFLFAKVYPFLFGGIKSFKILLTLNTKTSLFCSVIKSSPILLSSLIFLLVLSCETDKTPISPDTPKYTSHEFEWSADSLNPQDAYQVFMNDIWGTDKNNVWTVGHSDRSKYRIWHWDGESWKNVRPSEMKPGDTFHEIFGFSENELWIVGSADSSAAILHYDGTWNRIDNNLQHCYSLWGTSSENLFIGSRHGLIYKYNGQNFIRFDTGRNLLITTLWGLNTGEVFAIGVNNENQPAEPPIRYLFQYINDDFSLVDSVVFDPNQDKTIGMDLWGTDLDNFYSPTGSSLTKYVNGKWVTQFYANLWRIYGSSSNNIFTGGFKAVLYHYNGKDWKRLEFNDSLKESIWGMWCNDKFVFVIQDLGSYTRIWKGKQKNE